uniref:Uncharacterized protein n=1 Tax=unidentified TaxID=32644 RepID=A0A6G9W2G9_9ZZZZ|nr:hypothetical protein [unidentified]
MAVSAERSGAGDVTGVGDEVPYAYNITRPALPLPNNHHPLASYRLLATRNSKRWIAEPREAHVIFGAKMCGLLLVVSRRAQRAPNIIGAL